MKQVKVCLDAGHCGKYNRSPAVKDYYESDMNWKLHLLLKAELEQYGIEVQQTRSSQNTDRGVYDRGAASKGCDLFLSLHSNAVGDSVNESVDYPVVIVQLDGKGDELGKQLAAAIEQTMETKQGGRIDTKRGSNGEYFGVLRGAAAVGTMGMILEHSFHTQTRAAKWLLDESNLKKLAQVEAQIVAEYFGMSKNATAEDSDGVLYCVQSGAFTERKFAEALLADLKAAGFDGYIEKKQKRAAAAAPAKKSVDEIAWEVIEGKWGNNPERREKLIAAGYDYDEVQQRVNAFVGGW